MSAILLKESIDGVHVTIFQFGYIRDTTNPPHKILVKLCCEVHYIWWKSQFMEPEYCKYCINSNKTIILAIIMLVPNNNPQG